MPDVVSRVPKSLEDIKHWKGGNSDCHRYIELRLTVVRLELYTCVYLGSELRNWLMFFSIPVLHGILPNPYLTHFSLLVAAILILSSENITQEDLENAASYLKEFYFQFPHLYGNMAHGVYTLSDFFSFVCHF